MGPRRSWYVLGRTPTPYKAGYSKVGKGDAPAALAGATLGAVAGYASLASVGVSAVALTDLTCCLWHAAILSAAWVVWTSSAASVGLAWALVSFLWQRPELALLRGGGRVEAQEEFSPPTAFGRVPGEC
jgi:hypothetical protein